jgi:hypothetical protein
MGTGLPGCHGNQYTGRPQDLCASRCGFIRVLWVPHLIHLFQDFESHSHRYPYAEEMVDYSAEAIHTYHAGRIACAGAWCTVLHAALTYGMWLHALWMDPACVFNAR